MVDPRDARIAELEALLGLRDGEIAELKARVEVLVGLEIGRASCRERVCYAV